MYAKKTSTSGGGENYITLWRNYLILCCSSASSSPSSSSSGSVRCSPPETLASTPDSGYCYDSKVRGRDPGGRDPLHAILRGCFLSGFLSGVSPR